MTIPKLKIAAILQISILFVAILLAESCNSKPGNNDVESHSIYLVRHAEKADDGTKDPPLTEEGIERSKALALLLEDKGVKKIYSTDYKRTRSTAKPLAEALGLEIILYQPGDKSFSKKLKEEIKNHSILVVGHSNSTPALVNEIIEKKDAFKQLDERVYDQLFIISSGGTGNLKATTESFHVTSEMN